VTGQDGSGSPEKTLAPPIHFRRLLFDFDVAMHNDHKRTKVGVSSSVRRSRIWDRYTAIVKVRYGGTTWLMRPVAVASFPVPVEVDSRPNDQRHQVTFFWTFVVRTGTIDQIICNGCGPH
jgi:hypothetical protein